MDPLDTLPPATMEKRKVTVQINGLDKQSRTSAVDQSVSALLVAVADLLVTISIDISVGGQSITSERMYNRKPWYTASPMSDLARQVYGR